MKVVLLAGGFGSRLAEETSIKPKPMVEIGNRPIIEHIMNWYMKFGYSEFIICLGYKGSDIINYFRDYQLKNSTIVIDSNGRLETIEKQNQPWKIILAQTGIDTQTAGRIKKIRKFLNPNEHFFMTYGDGLSNVDLDKLYKFHKKNKKLATLTAVRPLARFGALDLSDNGTVNDFIEKPKNESSWINGGFFVLSEKVIDYIESYDEPWENGPINRLVMDSQLMAYKHDGFWQPMDTLREKNILCDLWEKDKAPWKVKTNKKIISLKQAI
ncbi:MAG: glucose-1-phosphate cytidylyltransferase [Rickettsiales bacterium]|nr:glucose-1-phosphate cytidylyltransferase [Rickettsiales bacterium]